MRRGERRLQEHPDFYSVEPPAMDEEIRAAARQFVGKIRGIC